MSICKRFFLFIPCLVLFAFLNTNDSLAACVPAVKVVDEAYSSSTIQGAYDYAGQTLGLTDFTLRLSGELFSEDLFIDGGSVVLDGGYDCSFTSKNSTTNIFGTLTISTGAVYVGGNIAMVSTDQCDFDRDLDGFTSIGSCLGSADDCNDNDFGIYPGALELCDGIDNNCDGQIDEGFPPVDADGDGYFGPGSCGGVADDCDDNDGTVHPGALDIPYDGIDQDCSGADLTFAGEPCLYCHTDPPPEAWPSLHDLTSAPDASCATCHAPFVSNIASGHYGQIVSTDGNAMTAGMVIGCKSCHDPNDRFHTWGTNTVWPKVQAVTPNISCDTCHENRAAAHETTAAHNNRLVDSECGACHTSDTSVPGSPGSGTLVSAADVDSLHRSDCAVCHNYTGTFLNAAKVRQVISEGMSGTPVSCLDCHAAHGDHTVEQGTGDLSYYAPGQLCSDCHVVSSWAEIEGIEHNVPTNGDSSCATCHNSTRQDVIDTIALRADPTHCLDCHADKELTPHGEHDHSATISGSAECVVCHDHSDAQVVEVIHSNNCATCHNSPRPEVRVVINSGQAECSDCHTAHDGLAAHNNLSAPADCAVCHTDKISGTDFTYLINNHGPHPTLGYSELDRCQRCHNSSVPEVVSTIEAGKGGAGIPVSCTNCHLGEHVSITSPVEIHNNILVNTGSTCSLCHIENYWTHTDMNATASCASCHASADQDQFNTLHQGDCLLCHLSQRAEVIGAIYDGIAGAAVECVTCHAAYWDDFFAGHQDPDHSAIVTTSGTGCGDCHAEPPPLVDPVDPTIHNECGSCHAPNGVLLSFAAGKSAPGNCTTCHTGSWESTHTTAPDHSALVNLGSSGCGACHSEPPPLIDGVDPKVHDACSSCHDAASGALVSYAIGKTFTAGGDCTTCHTGSWAATHVAAPDHSALVTVVGTSGCDSCHSDPPPLTDAADPKVHNTCTSCHDVETGALISLAVGKTFVAGGNCQSCHTDSWRQLHPGQPDHSGIVTVSGTSCGSCHDDTLVSGDERTHAGCSTCHDSQTGGLISLAEGKSAPGNCTSCHGSIWEAIHTIAPSHSALVTVSGTSCGSCHSDPPPLVDPDEPLNHDACSSCHDGNSGALISYAIGKTFATGGNCVTCHLNADSAHHSTSFSQTGDCYHCHTSLAVDRPAQAACRECHGTHMHDKGGPIQNYAACAACHNQAPYHAKPPRPLGYTRTTYDGKQTGKGRFAIWWSQWTNNGRDDEIVENDSPNGEDMNDEGGHYWANPSLDFDMYTIDHNGQIYQVPGFSPPAQSSGNPDGYDNLALNKVATASGDYGSSYSATQAVDGDDSSYWYERSRYTEWLKVDLGQNQSISKVIIKWHSSEYAEQYQVQISSDNYRWITVRDERYGNGGSDTVTFSSRTARYVRIYCTKEHNNGYGVYELEVYLQ